MDEGPIDLATLRSLQDAAGAAFVAELAQTFLEEAPRMLDALRSALEAKDTEAFRRTAHSLKSNSLTFGAMRLADLARDLERDAALAVARGEPRPVDALADEYARASAALAELAHA